MHTTASDQRAASKPEQETRAKGGSLSFYLSLYPHFSTLLFKQLRRAECWARQCLPEPGRTLFTFPFTLSHWDSSQQSAGARYHCKNQSGSRAMKGLRPESGYVRSGTLSRWVSKATEKRSTFHPSLVFVMLSMHTTAVYCANLLTLPSFKYLM